MTKDQWKSLYCILEDIYSDFEEAYQESSNGRNKNIRDAANKKVRNSIRLADIHIKDHSEAYELLTGDKEIPGYQRTFNYSDFLKPDFFNVEMDILLRKIKNFIN